MMKEENGFNFSFGDDFEDISSSSSSPKSNFTDIVSDSKMQGATDNDFISMSDISSNRYAKKPHGVKGFFHNIGNGISHWWHRMKRWQKALFISGTSIAVVAALILTVPYMLYNYHGITGNPEDLGFTDVIDEKIINVALFGLDSRDTTKKSSFTGNSDSIMILSLNTETKKVKVISVMRDTLAPIDKNGKTTYYKINAAYSWGGPELAIKTLNQVFDLDISEYATVNFYGMADIIDAVGGITATLTDREVSARGENNHGINDMIGEICGYMNYNPKDYYVTKSGEQQLNGVQAVAYSRIRYVANIWGTNNDFGRTDRQRYVMQQLFGKATKMKKSQYSKLIKALIPCTETSLSPSEILSLATNILLHSPTFEQARIPMPEFQMASPRGSFGSVVYYDLDYAAKVIHGMIYKDMTLEDFVAANPVEKHDWYGNRYSGSSGSSNNSSSSYSSSHSSVSSSSVTDSSDDTVTEPSEPSDNSSSASSDTSSTESTGSNNSSSTPSSSSESPSSSTPSSSSSPSSSTEPIKTE